jgi:small subunit ribosomal protein S17
VANQRRRLIGRVVSDKMQKTVVVEVERRTMHRIYKKVIVMKKRFYAHDEHESAPLGALVKLVESRPRSKLKRWAVETVLEGGRGDTD